MNHDDRMRVIFIGQNVSNVANVSSYIPKFEAKYLHKEFVAQISSIDLQLLESEKVTLRELCNVYGVNSALFNDPDNKTYNNMKEAKKEMLTQVVLPELVALRDAFNRFFSTEIGQGYYIDFDLTVFPELQEDMKELSAILSQS